MSIASEITKLNTNLTASYTACQNKGATMPTNQNFDNLATCVSSIPTATEPTLASLTVTPSTTAQTITPPSGTDGYNTVIASAVTASIDNNITAGNIKKDVSILGVTGTYEGSGGGSSTTYSYPDVQGNYYVLDDETVVPMCFDSITFNAGVSSHIVLGQFIEGIATVDNTYDNTIYGHLSTSTNANATLKAPTWYNTTGFLAGRTVKHISIGFPSTSVTQVKFQQMCFGGTPFANSLQSVRISNMNNLVLMQAFVNCAYLREVDMSTVDSMPIASALSGTAAGGGAFTNCTSLQTLSFPALKSTSFGNKTNQFNFMLRGVTGCTVHFPSNLQSVIGSWSSVTSGFSGTNTTVLFDLPATT